LLHVDPWSKVAECERAIATIADPERRIVFESLRSLWIELGSELPMSRPHTQLATVTQIHTQLMAGCRNAMH
jgi:hypothetical protein